MSYFLNSTTRRRNNLRNLPFLIKLFRVCELTVEYLVDQSAKVPGIERWQWTPDVNSTSRDVNSLIAYQDPLIISGDAYRPDSGNKLPYV